MKEKIYKYCLISLILINFWTLYGFFSYFIDVQTPAWFHGVGLYFFYFGSLIIGLGLSGILLLLRLIFQFKNRKNVLKTNFFYILFAIFNLNLIMISFISVYLEMLSLDIDLLPYLLSLIIITGITIFDIYKSNFGMNKKPTA